MRPKKILIDAHNLSSNPEKIQKTGIQEVVYSLLAALPEVRKKFEGQVEIIAVPRIPDLAQSANPTFTPSLIPSLNNTPAQLREVEQMLGKPSKDIWGFDLKKNNYEFTETDFAVLSRDADWLLVTSHLDVRRISALLSKSAPDLHFAYIFYDTIPNFFPELVPTAIRHWYPHEFFDSMMLNGSCFFPISRSAGLDLLEHYGTRLRQDASVIVRQLCVPLVESDRDDSKSLLTQLELTPKKYFLTIGSTDPRKNTTRLIRAFTRLLRLKPELAKELTLVIAGPKDWHRPEILEAIDQARKIGKVLLTGYVTDKDLHLLVKESAAVLMPSRYEGFGLPLAIAQTYGTPSVTSPISSLPEPTDAKSFFADPQSEDEISIAMLNTLKQGTMTAANPTSNLTTPESWKSYFSEVIRYLCKTDTS